MTYIPNSKERRLVVLTLLIALLGILAALSILTPLSQKWITNSASSYKGLLKFFGSIARIGFIKAFSILPFYLLLKSKFWKQIVFKRVQWKHNLQFLGMFIRRWHVPIAITSVSLAFIHGYMALLKGFKWNSIYLSGILCLLTLMPLMYMGLKRFKRRDRKSHYKWAIIFLLFLLLHAYVG